MTACETDSGCPPLTLVHTGSRERSLRANTHTVTTYSTQTAAVSINVMMRSRYLKSPSTEDSVISLLSPAAVFISIPLNYYGQIKAIKSTKFNYMYARTHKLTVSLESLWVLL